jgi:Protein of unknown function (DUF2510)
MSTALPRGWHEDPRDASTLRYWDGAAWTGQGRNRGLGRGASFGFRLHGWRRLWFQRVLRLPPLFYPLAWLNCSVPGVRGHLDRVMRPREVREFPRARR